jgi:photosystem II stability/assembly factor-like uncharacterized protein
MKLFLACLLAGSIAAQTPSQAQSQAWLSQNSGTNASLRGVSAVTPKVVWASGAGGVWLRTIDGGANWKAATVSGAEDLDFRGIHALDENTAWLMSSGPGDKSRIYKTTDAGAHWKLLFTSPDAKGFFDAITFWDARRGIVMGDAVNGQMTVFSTNDGGLHWARQQTPPALQNEGAFAASNSCLTVQGKNDAWFGTGGPGAARIFRSRNAGRTWTVSTSPIRNDSASSGVFSLAFSDARHGIATGGDYAKDSEARQNIAITSDSGKTWTAPQSGPQGFRSAVTYLADRKTWLVTGTSGSDISTDNGNTWQTIDTGPFNALSAISSRAAWAVGPRGRIAILRLE